MRFFIVLAMTLAMSNSVFATYVDRRPLSCASYETGQQRRDAYTFTADLSQPNPTPIENGTVTWATPGIQSPLTPLYEVMHRVSAGDDDYFATTSANPPGKILRPGWREDAIRGGFYDSNLPLKLYGDGKSIIGFIEGKCQPGTRRLSRFYSKRYGTHYYSTDGQAPSTARAPADAVWTLEETYEGYIWATQIPGSDPLKRCHFNGPGKYSSRIMTRTMIDLGALAPGYECETTPIGYIKTDDNYFIVNEARSATSFMQRCNWAGYTSGSCYPITDRLKSNLGGGIFQTSTNTGGKQIQQLKFTFKTPDFFENGTSSHMAFGLLSSVSVSGTYISPVLSNMKAVVLGMGPSSKCVTTSSAPTQPTVWLEALGGPKHANENPVIQGTCGTNNSGLFVFKNNTSYSVTFEVSRDGYAHYLVANTASSTDRTQSPLFYVGDKFFTGFPTASGYYATATENLNHDFTVNVTNINVSWRDSFSF